MLSIFLHDHTFPKMQKRKGVKVEHNSSKPLFLFVYTLVSSQGGWWDWMCGPLTSWDMHTGPRASLREALKIKATGDKHVLRSASLAPSLSPSRGFHVLWGTDRVTRVSVGAVKPCEWERPMRWPQGQGAAGERETLFLSHPSTETTQQNAKAKRETQYRDENPTQGDKRGTLLGCKLPTFALQVHNRYILSITATWC